MNPFFLSTKVWKQAQKENNRLILDYCSQEDVTILVRDSGLKSVKAATDRINSIVIDLLEFKKCQAQKNKK